MKNVNILWDWLGNRSQKNKKKSSSIFTSNFAKSEIQNVMKRNFVTPKLIKRPWWGWTVAVQQPQQLVHSRDLRNSKQPLQQCQCLPCQLQPLRISWEINWHLIFPNFLRKIHKNKFCKGKLIFFVKSNVNMRSFHQIWRVFASFFHNQLCFDFCKQRIILCQMKCGWAQQRL